MIDQLIDLKYLLYKYYFGLYLREVTKKVVKETDMDSAVIISVCV